MLLLSIQIQSIGHTFYYMQVFTVIYPWALCPMLAHIIIQYFFHAAGSAPATETSETMEWRG